MRNLTTCFLKDQAMNTKIYNVIALVLLALFFLPFVLKLQQLDLTILLLGGIAMPLYDLLSNQKNAK